MKTPTHKTYSAKPTDVVRKWYLVDASDASLGRLSTQIATLLTGKGKPQFTPHIDCGDYVVVINANNLVIKGNSKMLEKKYYRHSGYPGALKTATLEEKIAGNPSEVIEKAVRGMLPVNKLRPARLARLKVYNDDQHQHGPQQPEAISLAASKKETT